MQWRDPVEVLKTSYIPEPNSGCWLWERPLTSDGYGYVSVKSKSYLAHRMAWRVFHGPIPAGLCVCHRCDVRSCVNPEHLFLGTPADNTRDMYAKNRNGRPDAKGEKNPHAKLAAADVAAIRKRKAEGENGRILAKEYGVQYQTIWKITSNMRWT